MLDWITATVLINTGLGALAGLALGLFQYLFRDWAYLSHQWRYRRQLERGEAAYFEELRELEGYKPNPVTPQEREDLPARLALLSLIGAGLVLALQAPDPRAVFVLFAVFAVYRLIDALRKRPLDFEKLRYAVVELIWLAILVFGVDALGEWGAGFGVTRGALLVFVIAAMCLVLMAAGVHALRKGPPEDADRYELSSWRTTNNLLVFAPPAAGVLVAMAVLAF